MNARSPAWAALIVGLALSLSLFGLHWGLPSRARLERVLPPGLDTPAYGAELMSSWSKLHAGFGPNIMVSLASWAQPFTGVQRVAPGWTVPPPLLENSARSFFLRSAHEDEQTFLIVLSRMRPRHLQLNPHFFIYGGGYIYSLGAWLALCALLGLTHLHSSLAPYLADPSQMASLYYCGRLYTAACSAACGLMLVRIGRRHLGAEAGLFAALFFVLSPASLLMAHVMKSYMLWSLLVLWTLDLSLGLLDSGGTAAYAAAGAASGLAVGTFLQAWPSCLIVAGAAALRVWALRKPAAAELKGLAAAGTASAAAFFVVNPYWILDWPMVRAEMRVLSGWGTFDLRQPYFFLVHAFALSVTWPLFVLLVGGAIWALARGRREPGLWLCLFAFLAGLAMIATVANVTPVSQTRYFLGFTAFGFLLAGRAAADLLKSPRRAWAAAALALLIVQLGLSGATYANVFHADATDASSHVRAGRWLETHAVPGSSIGLLRLPQPSNAPYFRYDRYDLRFIASAALFAALPASSLPEYVVTTSPDYDDRPSMEPNLSRYALAARFDRPRLVPWIAVDPTSTTADPLIDIYRLKAAPAPAAPETK